MILLQRKNFIIEHNLIKIGHGNPPTSMPNLKYATYAHTIQITYIGNSNYMRAH